MTLPTGHLGLCRCWICDCTHALFSTPSKSAGLCFSCRGNTHSGERKAKPRKAN